MEWASKESLSLLYFLLPGFLAAWIFYGLTAHPKKDAFERVVQALIFTVIIQAITFCISYLLLLVGRKWFAVGPWTTESSLIWSVIVAVSIGVTFSALANTSWLHSRLWKLRLTKRTSYPGEWYSAFHQYRRFCLLHLKDGRRIRGWPEEWPDHCDKGHFLMEKPEWVLDTGVRIPLSQTILIIIPAEDVKYVEIEYNDNEVPYTQDQIIEAQKPLIELHKAKEKEKESENGK